MKTLASALLVAAGLAGAAGLSACETKAAVAQAQPADPLGPIACYVVADGARLASITARRLCAGAQSEAPARCFVAADQANELSETQSLALCYGATSTEPAQCAAAAAADGKTANQTIVQNCSARGAGIVVSSDVPACVAYGHSSLRLSDFQLAELCAPGSSQQGNF